VFIISFLFVVVDYLVNVKYKTLNTPNSMRGWESRLQNMHLSVVICCAGAVLVYLLWIFPHDSLFCDIFPRVWRYQFDSDTYHISRYYTVTTLFVIPW